jgi:DNA-directed RNA polymerase subunit alpha
MKSWSELVTPYKTVFELASESGRVEQIVVGPLEKGFGTTFGNALRRVLLSSIQGSAVSCVKIAGTFLEFSTLPGVIEDVTDIVLNLKGLNLRLNGLEKSQIFKIEARGPCVVTAGMIQGVGILDILDPEQVICTLTREGTFDAELVIERGKGYVSAPVACERKVLGEIMVDARFNPIRRVSYQVEPMRVGQDTDYERLLLTIETNGAVSPKEALSEAVAILQHQLASFAAVDPEIFKAVDLPSLGQGETARAKASGSLPQILFSQIKDLDLPARCQNCLKNAEIVYVGDLVKRREEELMRTPHLGKKSLDDIKALLVKHNLSLGMDLPDWPPEGRDE